MLLTMLILKILTNCESVLDMQFSVRVFRECLSICVCASFPFAFTGDGCEI